MNLNYLKLSFCLLLVFFSVIVFPQNSFSGSVTDENNEPIIGASVKINELSIGSSTDLEGQFLITKIPSGNYEVTVSGVGYNNIVQMVQFNTDVKIDFTLKEDVQLLDEAVVVGYGTARTKDLTGSAVAISEDKFLKGSLATPEQLIMGKVPGLKVTSNDGAPGSGSTLRIRGGTSINASNDPLIVIDGVPIDNGGIAGAANPLSLINPNDIESFVVLKDASASAIYGSRAANGVILITTKKGEGKLSVTVNQKTSISTIAKYADVLSGDSLWNLVYTNGTSNQIDLLGDTNYNTDWQKEVFRTAIINDLNVAVSKKSFRFSYGNRIDNGLLRRDQFIRNNVSLNLNPSFLDNQIMLELNNKLVQTNSNFSDRGALGAAYFDPTKPIESSNDEYGGYFEWLQNNGAPNVLAAKNPVGLINQKNDESQVQRYIGNAKISVNPSILPELTLNYNAGLDFSEGKGTVELLSSSASGYFSEGSFNRYRSFKRNYLSEAYLNYNNRNDSSNSYLDFTAGYSYQYWNSNSPNLPVYNQVEDSIIYPAAETPFFTENAIMSFYGRAIYNIQDKYVFNATLRRDGSSRFSPESRWGWFPSYSAAWIISEESFMSAISSLNYLKLRAGYGVNGQQDGIGDFGYISNYFIGTSTAQYGFGDSFYYVYRPAGFDGNLKWEETKSYNIGLDFGILNDRISGSVDLYSKITSDLLATVSVPAGTNFTNQVLTNVGGMSNRGVELNFNIGLIQKRDLRTSISANFTYNENRVTKLSLIEDTTSIGIQVGGISGGIGNTVQVHSINNPTFSYLLYEQLYDDDGVMIQVGEQANSDVNGDGVVDNADTWKTIHAFNDRNEDGVITPEDKYISYNPVPKFLIGAAVNVSFKNWYSSLSFRSEIGGYIYNNIHSNTATYQSVNGTQGFLSNISSLYYDSEVQNVSDYQLQSDHYLEKANFLRVDFFNVGYNFKNLIMNNTALDVSLSVQNLLLMTKYSGLDPELGGGIDNNIYPRPRVFSLNLKFNF
tara:strand:- start:2218 stop:5244 length:3027 start_codon:yes stop_codon:yes gene_type:complete